MQGKYQLQVFPDAGHFIHEDQPARTAQVLAEFWERNSRVLVLPRKVGEMVKEKEKEKEGEGDRDEGRRGEDARLGWG